MAINIAEKYPGRSNLPSVEYPQGSIKNQTAPGARDGTPLDEAWANDKEGFFQKALNYRGVTANGTPDTAISSQYFDALFANPTESLRGMPSVATQAEANAAAEDTKIITAKKLSARTATESRTGLVELATVAEATSGTDTTRAVTPAGVKAAVNAAAYVPTSTQVVAGNGLATGGALTGNVTLALATPGTLTPATTNAVQASSHTHNIDTATAAEMTAGTSTAKFVTPKLVADSTRINPTESVRGMPLVATQAETNAGTDDAKAVTPKKLRAGFSANFSTIGYIAFPSWLGGFIIQWGTRIASDSQAVVVTLPIAFKTQVTQIIVATKAAGNPRLATYFGETTTQFQIECWTVNGVRVAEPVSWIAIGN